jgi:hypothetical protein
MKSSSYQQLDKVKLEEFPSLSSVHGKYSCYMVKHDLLYARTGVIWN